MELMITTENQSTKVTNVHVIRFEASLVLGCIFGHGYNFAEILERELSVGMKRSLHEAYLVNRQFFTTEAVKLRCELKPSWGTLAPPFFERDLPVGTSFIYIDVLAHRMATRIRDCFSHGLLQQYIDTKGRRAVQPVQNIDEAPCFWPKPFDETSRPVLSQPKIEISNFVEKTPNLCDCGAEKCKTTHALWCSTRKEQS